MNKVTLVLGSGGARGLSFLGVLRVLNEAGIAVGHVVGSSMGAILGAAYCAGMPVKELIEQVKKWRKPMFLSFGLLGPSICTHRALRRLVERIVPARTFEELQIPLTVICTDLQSGESIPFSHGPLIAPVVASSVIAGVVDPVFHQGRYLVDGGYSDPVPARQGPTSMVKLVIDPSTPATRKIDLSSASRLQNLFKLPSVWSQALKAFDILIYRLGSERNRDCSGIFVIPDLGDMSPFELGRAEFAISAGETAMRARLGEVRSSLLSGVA